MLFFKRDELQFSNIFPANKFAILSPAGLLCLLNCITENIQVTKGHKYSSWAAVCWPALVYDIPLVDTLRFLACIQQAYFLLKVNMQFCNANSRTQPTTAVEVTLYHVTTKDLN
jgi:hypothetical protein